MCRNQLAKVIARGDLFISTVEACNKPETFFHRNLLLDLLLTGAVSVAGPVRRALHVDPANVLREQYVFEGINSLDSPSIPTTGPLEDVCF